ncbi:MAG: DUF2452 domain-containing protein [Bacteroidota bacterium]
MEEEIFENPIDKDKVAENPGFLPYAHSVGGAVVKPEDKGKIKGRAMKAMEQQTNIQLTQIQEQIQLLAKQARQIQERVEVSIKIYQAVMGFEPVIDKIYHLYEKKDGSWIMSLLSPEEWGRSFPYEKHISSAKLLADHTWKLLD